MKKRDKLKLTDEERHKRFLETAKKVEASDKSQDFDDAIANLLHHQSAGHHQPK